MGAAVDLGHVNKTEDSRRRGQVHPLLNVPAWHGTILPATDGDIWLAVAFAEYERYVAKEKAMKNRNDGKLTQANRDELGGRSVRLAKRLSLGGAQDQGRSFDRNQVRLAER